MDLIELVAGLSCEDLHAELEVLTWRRDGRSSEVRLAYYGAYGPLVQKAIWVWIARHGTRPAVGRILEDICTEFWEMIRARESSCGGNPNRRWKEELSKPRFGRRFSLKALAELHAKETLSRTWFEV